jgi:hypothetical protein
VLDIGEPDLIRPRIGAQDVAGGIENLSADDDVDEDALTVE